MNPPRLELGYPPLTELSCSPFSIPSSTLEGSVPLLARDAQSEAIRVVDSFVPRLAFQEFLQRPAYRPAPLFDVSWCSAVRPPPRTALEVSPELLLQRPVSGLSEAYVRSEHLSFRDFLPSLVELANQVESMDVDFFNVPVNRGTGLCRFSEYSPRTETVHECNVRVQADTRVRAHGEIRPIRGSEESLITRISVDFRPNVVNHVNLFPDLEIDGFSAVDPPQMTFDRRFLGRHRESILSMSGGDYDYENVLSSDQRPTTPFGTTVEPPPGGHRYFMFRFSPIEDSAIASLEASVGDNRLLLWAFLPTFGLVNTEDYAAVGVPFNTFPRRLGDLLQMFSPLFSSWRREELRQAGPYFNPNTEYLDIHGRRQFIPNDPAEVARINAELHRHVLPPIGRNRGSVIDWTFADILKDPQRLEALLMVPPAQRPYATARIRFRSTDLETPLGRIHLDPSTEARVQYGIEPVRNSRTGIVEGHSFLRLHFNPLALQNVDLEIQGLHLRAQQVEAEEVVVQIPSLTELAENDLPPQRAVEVRLEGVHIHGLQVTDRRSGVRAQLGDARVSHLSLNYHSGAWHLQMGGGEGGLFTRNLALNSPWGDLRIDRAQIPRIDLRQTFRGMAPRFSVEIPQVLSRGNLTFTRPTRISEAPLRVRMEGESVLNHFVYYYQPHGETIHQARVDFLGHVRLARIENETFGALELSTLRQRPGEAAAPIRGNFQYSMQYPAGEVRPRVYSNLELDLPFVALGSESSFLQIPRGSSTLEDGHISIQPEHFSLEGLLNIHGARLHGFGRGPTELGSFLVSAENIDIHDIEAQGRARFEASSGNWRLSRVPDSEEPLSIRLLVENLGLRHHPASTLLPREVVGRPEAQVVQTEFRLAHAEVEVQDLQELAYQQVEVASEQGERELRGRLSRLESGPFTAHHLQGGGSIWAPLPIWGMVRGLFPFLGQSSLERPPRRPDPGAMMAHLPPEVLCELGDGDFLRIGGISYRIYPLSPSTLQRRLEHRLSTRPPQGDFVGHLEDVLLNIHEAEIPGQVPSRGQFALVRIPEINFGRVWVNRPDEDSCPAAQRGGEDPVCGEETTLWNLGQGQFLANIYLNEPQRGGAFLFPRWPRPGSYRSLGELLQQCTSH